VNKDEYKMKPQRVA